MSTQDFAQDKCDKGDVLLQVKNIPQFPTYLGILWDEERPLYVRAIILSR